MGICLCNLRTEQKWNERKEKWRSYATDFMTCVPGEPQPKVSQHMQIWLLQHHSTGRLRFFSISIEFFLMFHIFPLFVIGLWILSSPLQMLIDFSDFPLEKHKDSKWPVSWVGNNSGGMKKLLTTSINDLWSMAKKRGWSSRILPKILLKSFWSKGPLWHGDRQRIQIFI